MKGRWSALVKEGAEQYTSGPSLNLKSLVRARRSAAIVIDQHPPSLPLSGRCQERAVRID